VQGGGQVEGVLSRLLGYLFGGDGRNGEEWHGVVRLFLFVLWEVMKDCLGVCTSAGQYRWAWGLVFFI